MSIFSSACRPAELSAAHEVEVKMKYALTGILSAVVYYAVAVLGNAKFLRDLGNFLPNVRNIFDIICI